MAQKVATIPTTTGPIGVLLVNLGTPDAPRRRHVFRYLKQFLTDPRVIDVPLARKLIMPWLVVPLRAGQSARAYRKLWTEQGSPLKVYGYALAEGVQAQLGDDFVVALAMRYQQPSIENAIVHLLEQHIRHLVVLPLFPQYAASTTASIQAEVMRVLQQFWYIPPLTIADSFYHHPRFLELFAQKGKLYPIADYDHFIFSYHGVPERHLTKAPQGNQCLTASCCNAIGPHNQYCYRAQCAATTRGIAQKLGLQPHQYTMSFQSRLGRDPWLQPYTEEVVRTLAQKGARKVLVCSPAFVADCLETTIEIGEEYAELFTKHGGTQLDLVPSLNDDPEWIDFIAHWVEQWVPMAKSAHDFPAQ